ncbi:C-module-binding factor A [Psilocybe cubensis]|uniref:C-module-binding factor A n=1 Tax=Psilocybe cubensis TaxID=181762 RepID=A0ACB8H727_PSICU|nr:C-module-binding factor A [Psilocybe cubensis]KAH9483676.1 C-module-binding factor A [Psilocybe cubensis]
MPTMEQRRQKLMREDNSLFAGITTNKISPPSTPCKPAPLTPPSSHPRPSSSKLTTESRDRDDDQAQGRARALSESHHNPGDQGARATNKEPEPAPQPESESSSFGFPTNENMPLASTKGWTLDLLIARAPRTFRHADRVSAALPAAELARRIEEYEESGRPLVIEGFHELSSWPKKKFTLEGFVKDAVEDTINARNVRTWTDAELKLSDFIEKSRAMPQYAQEGETERWYGKDMDCPPSWEDWLIKGNAVPASLHPNGPQDKFRYRPKSAEVQTLMCYLGIGDTFTPCHKDLCASSGHNLMCYTEKNGSSFWFMTESSVAPKASQYFQKLRHELDHENHIITLEELANAPFDVYILEQKLGDLVLVPPRSCHQVVNAGGITIKTSWSRMTSKGLKTAYFQELPIYRRVCRPETYKVKSTIFYSIIREAEELAKLMEDAHDTSSAVATTSKSKKNSQKSNISKPSTPESSASVLANDLMELISVADCILAEEYDSINKIMPQMFSGNRFEKEPTVICDFCRCDIFQSFFECRNCVDGGISSGERMHICAGCYVEGRSCDCSNMQPIQYGNFQDLVDAREMAVSKVSQYEKLQGRSYSPKLSKCFAHLLENSKMHAVEALLLHTGDKTPKHEKYHSHHLSKSAKYYENLPALEESQREGTRHPGFSWLVYNALSYSHCTPLNLKYVRFGWYDNQLFEEESEHELASTIASTDVAPSPSSEETPSVRPTSLQTSPKVTIILKPSSSSAKPKFHIASTSLEASQPQDKAAIPQTPKPTLSQPVRSPSADSADIEMVDSFIRPVSVDYVSSDDEPLIKLLEPAKKKQKLMMIIPPSPKRIASGGGRAPGVRRPRPVVQSTRDKDDITRRLPRMGQVYVLVPPAPYSLERRPPPPPPPVTSPRPPSPALSIRSESPLTSLRSESPLTSLRSDSPLSELSRRSESPPLLSSRSTSRKIVESEPSEDEIEDTGDEAMQPGPSTLPKLDKCNKPTAPYVGRKPLIMTEEKTRSGPSISSVLQARNTQHLSTSFASKDKGKGKMPERRNNFVTPKLANRPAPSKVPPIPRKTNTASSSAPATKDVISSTRVALHMTGEVTRPRPPASLILKRKSSKGDISASVPEYSHKVGSGGKSSTGARAGPLSKTTKRQKTSHLSNVRQPEEGIGATRERSPMPSSPSIVVTLPQRPTALPSRVLSPSPSTSRRKSVKSLKSTPTAKKDLAPPSTMPAKSIKSIPSTTSSRPTKPLPVKRESAPSVALDAAAGSSNAKLRGQTFTARSGLVGRVGKGRSESQTTDFDKEREGRSTNVAHQVPSASSSKLNTSGSSKLGSKKRPRTRASEPGATSVAEQPGSSKFLSVEQSQDKSSTNIDTTQKPALNKLRFKKTPAPTESSAEQQDNERLQKEDVAARPAERGHHHFLEVDADVDCTSASNLVQSNSEVPPSYNNTDVAPSIPTPITLLPPPLPPPLPLEPSSVAPPPAPSPPPPQQQQQRLEASSQTPQLPMLTETSHQASLSCNPIKPSWEQMMQDATQQGSPGPSSQLIPCSVQPQPSIATAPTGYVNNQHLAFAPYAPYAIGVQPQVHGYDHGYGHRGPPRGPRSFYRGSYSHRHQDELSGDRRYGNSDYTYPRHYDREDRRYNDCYQRASRFDFNSRDRRGGFDFDSRDRRGEYQRFPPRDRRHDNQGRAGHRSTHHRSSFPSSSSDRNYGYERGSRRRSEYTSYGGDRDMDVDSGRHYSPERGGHDREPRGGGHNLSASPPMEVDGVVDGDDSSNRNRQRDSSVHPPHVRDVGAYGGGGDFDDRVDFEDYDEADVRNGKDGKGGDDSAPAQQQSPTRD